MDEVCRICKNEKRNNENHELYKRCKKFNVRCYLKSFYANRQVELKKNIIILTENKLLI